MPKLLEVGYVDQHGDRFWITAKGLKVAALFDSDDDLPYTPSRAKGRAAIASVPVTSTNPCLSIFRCVLTLETTGAPQKQASCGLDWRQLMVPYKKSLPCSRDIVFAHSASVLLLWKILKTFAIA